jgi:hypothetical protein
VSLDRRLAVLRILDDQNRLGERADTKAISLLSALSFFTAFLVTFYRSIPSDLITIGLIICYFGAAISAILNIIIAVIPRIRVTGLSHEANEDAPYKAAFFGEISRFHDLFEYRKCLDNMLIDESTVIDVYIRQIYEVSHITVAKYKYATRAFYLVVIALLCEFALIGYLFIRGIN